MTGVWAEIKYNHPGTSSCTASRLGWVSRPLTRFWPFSMNVGQTFGNSLKWWAFFRPLPTVFKQKRSLLVRRIAKQPLANDEYLIRCRLFRGDNVYMKVGGRNGKHDVDSCACRRRIAKSVNYFPPKRWAPNMTD